MKFYEYQTKTLFAEHGIAIPKGRAITEVGEVSKAIEAVGGTPVVIKAQVLAGGRGKAGGIQFAASDKEAKSIATQLLGKTLTTVQSGSAGETIRTLYVEAKSTIDKSLYLGLVVDRQQQAVTIIASGEGGVEIETVAEQTPEKIHTATLPTVGYSPYIGRNLAKKLGLEGKQLVSFATLLGNLCQLFVNKDASLVEINPLVVTTEGNLVALDGKLSIDDNAAFRQRQLAQIYQQENRAAENQLEQQAREIGVSFVSLDGNIGCMVNGAGLAMATMDLIKLYGGEPANFLDVGGSVSSEQVSAAFKLLTSSKRVKGILVNIFGGIVHCDRVAKGIVTAAENLSLDLPVVVRLEGTHVEQGRSILAESGLTLIPAESLEHAAKTIVERVQR